MDCQGLCKTRALYCSLTQPDSRPERDGGSVVDMERSHLRPESGLFAFVAWPRLWPREIHIVRLFRALAATAVRTRKPCECKG